MNNSERRHRSRRMQTSSPILVATYPLQADSAVSSSTGLAPESQNTARKTMVLHARMTGRGPKGSVFLPHTHTHPRFPLKQAQRRQKSWRASCFLNEGPGPSLEEEPGRRRREGSDSTYLLAVAHEAAKTRHQTRWAAKGSAGPPRRAALLPGMASSSASSSILQPCLRLDKSVGRSVRLSVCDVPPQSVSRSLAAAAPPLPSVSPPRSSVRRRSLARSRLLSLSPAPKGIRQESRGSKGLNEAAPKCLPGGLLPACLPALPPPPC